MTDPRRTSRNILGFCSAIALTAAFCGIARAGDPSRSPGHAQHLVLIDNAGRPLAEGDRVGDSAPEAEAVRYTCPMHPEVVADSPGRCPHCGMKLVEQEHGPK